MTTQFTNSKLNIDDNTRLSVSKWQDGTVYRASVAIQRLERGKWQTDYSTVQEVNHGQEWMRNSRVGLIEDALYKAETGEVMPLGFYKNNTVKGGQ